MHVHVPISARARANQYTCTYQSVHLHVPISARAHCSGFEEAVRYISTCTKERLNTPSLCYTVGTHRLPYIPVVFVEVLKFVKQCLETGIPDEVVVEKEKFVKLRDILSQLPGKKLTFNKVQIVDYGI